MVNRVHIIFSLVAVVHLAALLLIYRNYIPYQTRTPSASVYSQNRHEEANAKMTSQFGYILATDFSDQMTAAVANVLSLQCWAGAIGERLMVVEPFVTRGSSLGVNLISAQTAKQAEELLRLQDVINTETWEKETKDRYYAPFKSWKDFLESAPKNLIVVGKACKIGGNDDNTCNNHFNRSASLFAEEHNFNIVRSVQVKYKNYSHQEFRNLIYGYHKPNQSVVLFHHWGGIVGSAVEFRIALLGPIPCSRGLFWNFLHENSLKIIEDSKRYLDRYMPNGDYVSVMLRLELLLKYHSLGGSTLQEQKLALVKRCVNGIVKEVRTMQKLHKITRLFLTTDCQKHGSDIYRDTSNPQYMVNKDFTNTTMNILFSELKSLGIHLSLKEWESSFDEVASFQTPGYVALLQKQLAASGTCLVTAGGGTFQASTRALYNSIHKRKNTSSQCVASIPQC